MSQLWKRLAAKKSLILQILINLKKRREISRLFFLWNFCCSPFIFVNSRRGIRFKFILMNELKTIFTFDTAAADKKIDLTEKKLQSIDARLNKLGSNPTFGKNLNSQFDQLNKGVNQFEGNLKKVSNTRLKSPTDDLLKNALTDIEKMQSQTIAGEKAITKSIEREAKLQADIKIREQHRAANNFLSTLNQRKPSSGAGSDLLGGFGVPIGIGAGVAFTGVAAKASLDAARDGANANRVLAASAKEASISYQTLSKEVETFSRLTLQSERNAKQTLASITDFARQAGRLNKLTEFNKSLADLTAAKGIKSEELPALLSQLKTGQDEVFDRLKGANPSQFYEQYAKAIGRTNGDT